MQQQVMVIKGKRQKFDKGNIKVAVVERVLAIRQ
jgi:hypothetical protein